MGSIQAMLVCWGIVLFSSLVLTFENAANDQITVNYENEALITATTIGQSVLESIQVKAFDENTVAASVSGSSSLTATPGAETGESGETSFDDIDDYDNFQTGFQMARLDSFAVAVDVYYIDKANPDAKILTRTFSKRIDVAVANKYLDVPVTLFSIVSY